jgi:lipopolysaccharide biosynthesis glycosyltransferase
MKTQIHLAVAFDRGYLNPFYALTSSIFFNNDQSSFFFHCIAPDLSQNEKDEIKVFIETNQGMIQFYDVDPGSVSDLIVRSQWSVAVYYRIFFPLMIDKSIDRLLYLDCDTLVVGSLAELYNIDLAGFPVAAVRDLHVRSEAYTHLHQDPDYFNSGMMLVDVNRWNALQVSQRTFGVLRDTPEEIFYVDQDALNHVLRGQCLLIPERYNFTFTYFAGDATFANVIQKTRDAVILHFNLTRPWHFLCRNRLRELYRFYLRLSPRKKEKVIIDFSWDKIPRYLRIRATEYYLDSPLLRRMLLCARRMNLIVSPRNITKIFKIIVGERS